MRRWYWYQGRLYRRRWCTCGHEDLRHLGLTGRCLAPGGPAGAWADECAALRTP